MAGADAVVLRGDCVEVMRGMEEASVDAIVCDPPYGLGFMGHEWDQPGDFAATSRRRGHESSRAAAFGGEGHPAMEAGRYDLTVTSNRRFQAWCEAWACEAFRVLKPGGHLLAFGGTRTYHRLTCGIEDAGFEVRDCLVWLYGSGFPKSLDVSKAIDKSAGAEREVVGPGRYAGRESGADLGRMNDDAWVGGAPRVATAPVTVEAEQWDGWGTALKPAHEPIVVARKPLIGTVAANVLAHGTGAVNVGGCRIGTGEGGDRDGEASAVRRYVGRGSSNFAPTPGPRGGGAAGRWPANVVLDEQAAAMLDEQTGELRSGEGSVRRQSGADRDGNTSAAYGAESRPAGAPMVTYGDAGGASRFFYCAKASRAEREAGLAGLPLRDAPAWSNGEASPGTFQEGEAGPRANLHPTVKPVDLMRWLVRLVTPPGGLVLDPFAGSGTTGCAAAVEGVRFVGIEREEDYAELAERRIAWWAKHGAGAVDAARPRSEPTPGAPTLFSDGEGGFVTADELAALDGDAA